MLSVFYIVGKKMLFGNFFNNIWAGGVSVPHSYASGIIMVFGVIGKEQLSKYLRGFGKRIEEMSIRLPLWIIFICKDG